MADLIETYVHETKDLGVSERYRRMCGVALTAGALGRRTFTQIKKGLPLYPNMYTVLVGSSGAGKTTAMRPIKLAMDQLEGNVFTPDEVTHASLLEDMGKFFTRKTKQGRTLREGDRSMFGLVSEIATFLPGADILAMQSLAAIWDCELTYNKSTKTAGKDFLIYHCLNMVLGAQPPWFVEGFPANSYELGFPARLILVWDAHQKEEIIECDAAGTIRTYRALWPGVERAAEWKGFTPLTEKAQVKLQAWIDGGKKPAPTNAMLMSYNEWRTMHLTKLAFAMAASDHPQDQKIASSDLTRAMDLLFEIEVDMPNALVGAGGNIFSLRERQVEAFVARRYRQTKKPVQEFEVLQRLGELVPSHMVIAIVDQMARKQTIRVVGKHDGARLFLPGVRMK